MKFKKSIEKLKNKVLEIYQQKDEQQKEIIKNSYVSKLQILGVGERKTGNELIKEITEKCHQIEEHIFLH